MYKFNNWLAKKLGEILGSMYFFYLCVVLDLIELSPVIKAHNTITWVTYLSQTVIQLVGLPILQVYQNLQSANHQETVDHLKAIHHHLGIDHSVQTPLLRTIGVEVAIYVHSIFVLRGSEH